jgi:hypothetical protein
MSKVEIIEVNSRRLLKAFVLFPIKLYADCPNYVPPLISDEMSTFIRENNPLYETSEAMLFLAQRDDTIVGRVAGIISHTANEKFGTKNLRFGWFDSIDDQEVAQALFDAIENWGRAQGMKTITGPQGFNQFGKAGMLIQGFDKLPTMATYYNHPYYADLMERTGFVKDVDYIEFRIKGIASQDFPQRLVALTEKLRRRNKFRVLNFPNKRAMMRRAPEIFDCLQDTYTELYGVTPLPPNQRKMYMKKFFPFLHESLVKVAVNERDEMIGFLIAMPSLSKALQKAHGRLFPFGFYHLWRASRGASDVLDFCLAGVRKHCRGRGVDILMASEMRKSIAQLGFDLAESNPELETNRAIQGEWKSFDSVMHKRRRVYKKNIV